jgi:precorrin-3B synthase
MGRGSGRDERQSIELAARPPLGVLRHGGRAFAIGVAAPFGRVEASMLAGLTDAAAAAGASDIRVSPWRILYVPLWAGNDGAHLLEAAERLGFLVEPGDPLLKIEACPGAPACGSARLDTRAAALAIANMLPRLAGVESVHVSGCSKGCARSRPADLVLSGRADWFAVIRDGRADGAHECLIAPPDLARLPEIVAVRPGALRDG